METEANKKAPPLPWTEPLENPMTHTGFECADISLDMVSRPEYPFCPG